MKSSVDHKPTGPWEFDESVSACFDDMIQRSVPLYQETIELAANYAMRHLRDGDTVVDIGVSNGQAINHFRSKLSDRKIRFIGLDNSKPMLERAKQNLPASVELIEHDLRKGLPYRVRAAKPRVILSFWTLQFIPIEYRYQVVREMQESLLEDGACFVAEKIRGQTAAHETACREVYRNWKMERGYSKESIETKAESLEGTMTTLSAPENKAMLTSEGLCPEEYIRYNSFGAYYCLKSR